MEKIDTTATRSLYGELIPIRSWNGGTNESTTTTAGLIWAATALAKDAALKGKLPMAYDDMKWGVSGRERGKRIGIAVHHEVYDVSPDGKRALLCVRRIEGTKYGVKTLSKEYFLLTTIGRGIRVLPTNKALAGKAAKASGETIGFAIQVCLGKAKLKLEHNTIRTGYKLVVQADENGVYHSVWDGSVWRIGKTRREKATDNHAGGFYYYASIEECIASAHAGTVFGAYRDHGGLALMEVEASGKHYSHLTPQGIKWCATRMRLIREIAYTLPAIDRAA